METQKTEQHQRNMPLESFVRCIAQSGESPRGNQRIARGYSSHISSLAGMAVVSWKGRCFHGCSQLEMQVHTTTLVSQVREEHLTGITKQTDALAGLAGDIEHIKQLLSCAPSHSQQPRSRVQEARVPGQEPNFPPQSTVRSYPATIKGQSTHTGIILGRETLGNR